MTYRFIEEEATADIAFEARGQNIGEVFRSAGDAVMNVMIDNLEAVKPGESREIQLENNDLDLLLVDLLQGLIYYKDAEQLLLRISDIQVSRLAEGWRLRAVASGERLDPARHHQRVDVKAVTLHNLSVEQLDGGWRAHVVLDI